MVPALKVTSKLAAAFSVSAVTILAISGALAVQREDARFWFERTADHDLLGRALATSLADTVATAGDEGVEREIGKIGAAETEFLIQWVPESRQVETRPGFYTTAYPVLVDGSTRGQIVISESLKRDEEYVKATIAHAIARTIAVVLGLAVTGWVAGIVIVGRPVDRLLGRLKEIRLGNLTVSVEVPAHDEMGTLAAELNEMCGRLQSTLDQLRHADRLATVGTLASGIAHELGTPLNVVLIRASMIADGDSESTPGENAVAIREQANRMTTLIRQLLDFARQSKPARSNQDLRAICSQGLAILEPIAAKKSVQLSMEPGEPALAFVDPGQVQQVITNLVLNGIHAMRAKGLVEIVVDSVTRAPGLEPDAPPRLFRRVVVSDQGDGIPRENLGRIFEPFFTTKGVGDGTGLGLAIVWGIVRENGGWVDVESETGKGARFSVYFPAPEVS